MSTVLRSNQHELCPSDDEAGLIMFGTLDTGYLTTVHPSVEAADVRAGDVERVREDGIVFGEDYTGAKTATFEIAVLTDRADDPSVAGSDALGALEAAWTDPGLRETAGNVAVLRSMMTPGSVRRAYGRPRRYADTPSGASKNGLTTVVCDFIVGDGRWYGDVEQEQSCGLVRELEGGIIAPIVAPITTTPAVTGQSSAIRVGGTAATWPVITFHAGSTAVTNPWIPVGDFKVALTDTIDPGMSVTVDPRPWVRTVTRTDGASRAGKLSYDTPPMRNMRVKPGTYAAQYHANDSSSTSWCEIRWRDAYTRW